MHEKIKRFSWTNDSTLAGVPQAITLRNRVLRYGSDELKTKMKEYLANRSNQLGNLFSECMSRFYINEIKPLQGI